MKPYLKFLVLIVAAMLVVPVFAFVAYDAFVVAPRVGDLRTILSNADPLDRSPPANIRLYIHALHSKGASPSELVAMRLHSRFLQRSGVFRSHIEQFLWARLISLHLSEDEVLALYSTLAYNGEGTGLNALSRRMFAKPLSDLDDREAATLVAYTRAPGVYARDPASLSERRDRLISEARSGL